MRRVPGDFDHFLIVVVGDERLVRVQLLERFGRLYRIGVDDAIPDKCLSLLLRQILDVVVDSQKLGDDSPRRSSHPLRKRSVRSPERYWP